MSRGPGIWQRQILESTNAGKLIILTSPEFDHATQNAIRRAARTLADAGKIKIAVERIDDVNRLVAAPIDADTHEPRKVTGLDGKTYIQPGRHRPASTSRAAGSNPASRTHDEMRT